MSQLRVADRDTNWRESMRRYRLSLPMCSNCGNKKLRTKRSQATGLCAACEDELIIQRVTAKRQPIEPAPEGSPVAWW